MKHVLQWNGTSLEHNSLLRYDHRTGRPAKAPVDHLTPPAPSEYTPQGLVSQRTVSQKSQQTGCVSMRNTKVDVQSNNKQVRSNYKRYGCVQVSLQILPEMYLLLDRNVKNCLPNRSGDSQPQVYCNYFLYSF